MPRGTFLLRFSETNVDVSTENGIHGYLTIAVIELDPQNSGWNTHIYLHLMMKFWQQKEQPV